MDIVLKILTLVGSFGLFLFGVRLLGEALLKIAGKSIRHLIYAGGTTTLQGVASGCLISGVAQSSGAVSGLIVSFVNSGLITLRRALPLIMGANIGASVIIWLICFLGFQLSGELFAVPLAGLGFALILVRKERAKYLGHIIMGFALIFIGLDVMQYSFMDIAQSTIFDEILREYATISALPLIIILLAGVLLTALIRSSSATTMLAIVICVNGWMPLEAGAAMVIGNNIGTTLSANLAALDANTAGKRVAVAHTIINLVGAIYLLPLTPMLISGLSVIFSQPFVIAAFYTLFNIINVSILMNFIPIITRTVSKVIPNEPQANNRHLLVMDCGVLSTSEISIAQAENEIKSHAKRTLKMFGFVRKIFSETDEAECERLFARVEKYEQITDRVEREIINYLTQITRSDLSSAMVERVQDMFRITSHIESLADTNLAIARLLREKRAKNIWFSGEQRNNVALMMDEVRRAMECTIAYLESASDDNYDKAERTEKQINKLYYSIREEQFEGGFLVYFELLRECEKLGDSAFSIVKITKG